MTTKLQCDLCGEWKVCKGYQGKLLLCNECAMKLTQDLVDDHYDPEEGVVVMRFNFERIDPHKVYEQRYKDCISIHASYANDATANKKQNIGYSFLFKN